MSINILGTFKILFAMNIHCMKYYYHMKYFCIWHHQTSGLWRNVHPVKCEIYHRYCNDYLIPTNSSDAPPSFYDINNLFNVYYIHIKFKSSMDFHGFFMDFPLYFALDFHEYDTNKLLTIEWTPSIQFFLNLV